MAKVFYVLVLTCQHAHQLKKKSTCRSNGFTVASCPRSGPRQCPLGRSYYLSSKWQWRIGASPLDNCDAHLEINSSNCQFTETEIWDTTVNLGQSLKNLKSFLKGKKHSSNSLTAGSPRFHRLSPVRRLPPRKMNKLRCVGPSSAQTLRAAWPCSKEGK